MTEQSVIIDLSTSALTALLPEWQLALRGGQESRHDRGLLRRRSALPAVVRVCRRGPDGQNVAHTWMAQMLDAGAAPGTVRTRQLAARRFGAWLIDTGQLSANPFLGIKGPVQRRPVVMPPSDDELRAGELIALHTDDLDLPAGRITIRFGKGGRSRIIPVGPATVQAIRVKD